MEGNNPSAVSTPPTGDIPSIVHQPTMADKILNEEHVARAVGVSRGGKNRYHDKSEGGRNEENLDTGR